MPLRVDLPGGHWADLRTLDELTGADQDGFTDLYDRLLAAKPQPAPVADPANPAVMLEPPRPRLTGADQMAVRDYLLSRIVAAWSFPPDTHPLPYRRESRSVMSLAVCDALDEKSGAMQRAIMGVAEEEEEGGGPKTGESPGSDGSGDTSPGNTQSPLPEPAGVLSGMP